MTRRTLLEGAFREIYRHGYQAAGLDAIVAGTGVTRGALYHHFGSKAEMGLAVIDEVVGTVMQEDWIDPVSTADSDPIGALQRVIRAKAEKFSDEELALGCPLNNLAQEMSPIDPRFRARIDETFDAWEEAFASALERGQADGTVRRELNAREVAAFIVASVEGTFGRAKNANSRALLDSSFEVLISFLDTLRTTNHPEDEDGRGASGREAVRSEQETEPEDPS